MKKGSRHDSTASSLNEHTRDFISGEEELGKVAPRLARLALRKMNMPLNMAEDLGQTGLLKYFQMNKERRGEIEDKKAYLYRIIRNELLNQFRKEKPYVFTSLETLQAELVVPPSVVRHEEITQALGVVWSNLEGDDRRVFRALVLGYTGPELACELGLSENAARQRVARFKIKLKRILTRNRKNS